MHTKKAGNADARENGGTARFRYAPERTIAHVMNDIIYKIATREQWQAAEAAGRFDGAPVDLADGFIHFSTAAQLRGTLEKHFAGQAGLVLAAVAADAAGEALRWEPSRGGDMFPHLYRALRLDEVLWNRPLPVGPDGAHALPAEARP